MKYQPIQCRQFQPINSLVKGWEFPGSIPNCKKQTLFRQIQSEKSLLFCVVFCSFGSFGHFVLAHLCSTCIYKFIFLQGWWCDVLKHGLIHGKTDLNQDKIVETRVCVCARGKSTNKTRSTVSFLRNVQKQGAHSAGFCTQNVQSFHDCTSLQFQSTEQCGILANL